MTTNVAAGSHSRYVPSPANNIYLVPYKPGDLSSLPYKTGRYVLSSLRVINKLSNDGLDLSVLCGSV